MAEAFTNAPGTPPPNRARVTIFTAARIALRYRGRVPGRDELIADYGMSRAEAYRWINAFKAATGAA